MSMVVSNRPADVLDADKICIGAGYTVTLSGDPSEPYNVVDFHPRNQEHGPEIEITFYSIPGGRRYQRVPLTDVVSINGQRVRFR